MYTTLIEVSYVPGIGDAAMNMSDSINPSGAQSVGSLQMGWKVLKPWWCEMGARQRHKLVWWEFVRKCLLKERQLMQAWVGSGQIKQLGRGKKEHSGQRRVKTKTWRSYNTQNVEVTFRAFLWSSDKYFPFLNIWLLFRISFIHVEPRTFILGDTVQTEDTLVVDSWPTGDSENFLMENSYFSLQLSTFSTETP